MEDLDALKHDVRVLKVYEKYVKLSRQGPKYIGLCPLHSESSGSFCVFAKDMLFHCFGCSERGNIFQLVEKKENCDFKTAVQKVKDIVGESNYSKQAARVDAVFKPAVEAPKDYKVFTLQQFSAYEKALADSKEAQAWLAGRGITLQTAQKLHVGFRQDVGKLSAKDSAGGWIAFPTVEADKVTSIKYRSIVSKSFTKQPGMATALFNANTIDPFSDVLVVEGECDVLALEGAGYRAVSIASASTSLTPQQKDKLMSASRVILAGDNDEPGQAAMTKLWRELPERCYVLQWPEGKKDANQFFLESCKGSVETFVQKMDDLIGQALKQPMKDVYDLQSVMMNGSTAVLANHPLRLRLPWPGCDQMAILLPGSVTTVMSTNSGMGKSSWVLQATLYGAQKYNETVLAYHCEMSPQELGVMVAAQVLKKNRNFLTREDLKEAAESLGNTKYYVGYDSNLTTAESVLDLLDIAIPRLGCTVAIIDHIHHLCQDENNSVSQQSAAMQRIKQMAIKHQVKFIVVAQPRKANQQNKGKQLHMTDAKGSESISSMADAMFAIHREVTKSNEGELAEDTYEARTLIKALKTRSKGEGKMESYLTFCGSMSAFVEVDHIHEEPLWST